MKGLTVITGVLLIFLGLMAFFTPFRVFLGMGWVLGILLAVNGIQLTIEGFKQEKKDWLHILLGALEVILGVAILVSGAQRILTDVMIAYMIGFYVMLNGVVEIVTGWKLYKAEEKQVGILRLIMGILSVILGFLAVGHPVLTMISVGFIIAFNVSMQGISMIIVAVTSKGEE